MNKTQKRQLDKDMITAIGNAIKINELQKRQLDDWKYEVSCCIDEIKARDKKISDIKKQAARIPDICKHPKCVFEIGEVTTKANYKRIQEMKEECPQICPKWRDNK